MRATIGGLEMDRFLDGSKMGRSASAPGKDISVDSLEMGASLCGSLSGGNCM